METFTFNSTNRGIFGQCAAAHQQAQESRPGDLPVVAHFTTDSGDDVTLIYNPPVVATEAA